MSRANGFLVSVPFIKRNGEVECVSQCAVVQRFRVTQGRGKRQHSVVCRRQWIGLCRKVDFHAGFRRRRKYRTEYSFSELFVPFARSCRKNQRGAFIAVAVKFDILHFITRFRILDYLRVISIYWIGDTQARIVGQGPFCDYGAIDAHLVVFLGASFSFSVTETKSSLAFLPPIVSKTSLSPLI